MERKPIPEGFQEYTTKFKKMDLEEYDDILNDKHNYCLVKVDSGYAIIGTRFREAILIEDNYAEEYVIKELLKAKVSIYNNLNDVPPAKEKRN